MVKDVHIILIAFVVSLVFFSALIVASGGIHPVVTPAGGTPAVTTVTTPVSVIVPVRPAGPVQEVRLVTTPAFNDTGLPGYLKPMFDEQYHASLQVIAKDTNEAVEMAKRGDADILLLNDPAAELAFLQGGYGVNRRTFAYNSFIIAGPADDPAGIRGMTVEKAFQALLAGGTAGNKKVRFISRADGSEVHQAEQLIWERAGYAYDPEVTRSGAWYTGPGKGMVDTLRLAGDQHAYTLADVTIYQAGIHDTGPVPLVTKGELLANGYNTIAVYNDKKPVESIRMANNFINFMLSPGTQQAIGDYGKEQNGMQLFIPAVGNTPPAPGGLFSDPGTPAVAIKPLEVYYPSTNPSFFGKLKKEFERVYPENDVLLWPGTNAGNIDTVGSYGRYADLLATTSGYLVWETLYPDDVTFVVTYAKNGMVIAYTNRSRDAATINETNWYRVLERDGVRYATSDPNTEPVGYRAYMLIGLAERYYGDTDIFQRLIGSHSNITEITYRSSYRGRWTINVTNPSPDNKKLFIAGPRGQNTSRMLEDGRVDYIFTYKSVAERAGFQYVSLPPEIDLSDPNMTERYQSVRVIRTSRNILLVTSPAGMTIALPEHAAYAAGDAGLSNLADGEEVPAVNDPEVETPYQDSTGSPVPLLVISSPSSTAVMGRPLAYSITIPVSAHNAEGGANFINLLIGRQGQAIIISEGQTPISPAMASGYGIPNMLLPKLTIV